MTENKKPTSIAELVSDAKTIASAMPAPESQMTQYGALFMLLGSNNPYNFNLQPLYEGMMLGIAERLDKLDPNDQIQAKYLNLMLDRYAKLAEYKENNFQG